jgi:pyruvate dehydrogenase E2 component (dihydrolipoamide acetyltransferase)
VAIETIKVPDIGGAEGVEVIELCVTVGDTVTVEDSIIVVETDKASMDLPTPVAGKIVSLKVAEGDKVSEGDLMVEIEVVGTAVVEPVAVPAVEAPAAALVVEASAEQSFNVPDLGGSEGVEVIEICVAVGDEVAEGDSLIVLETDKASMEIPAEASGTVLSIAVTEGDKVSPGDAMVALTVAGNSSVAAPVATASVTPVVAAPAATSTSVEEPLILPDLGGSENVEIIEICVAAGDDITEGTSVIVLETDKASMEIPAPKAGKIISLSVNEGDKVSAGDAIGVILVESVAAPVAAPAPSLVASAPAPVKALISKAVPTVPAADDGTHDNVYAGPAVRKLARQMGVTLSKVKGSGPRGRLNKDDVRAYVKQIVQQVEKGASAAVSGGTGIPIIPSVDFSKFGDIELVKRSKVQKLTADNMVRNWLNVPHVTQWDDADITELEAFRKGLKPEAEKRGSKLTPLPFLLKACAAALRAEESFNVSLHADGEHIVKKDYVHIGIAVDSPVGLVVPVIRDVDKKGLWELADEFTAIVAKARSGKLLPKDMQGGCFTISSLGAMGGNGFTPIVNAPEVAILGVSKAQMKPVWNGKDFDPRNMLPLSLSYDHRAVNGADAGRFFTYLTAVLSDVRRLLL